MTCPRSRTKAPSAASSQLRPSVSRICGISSAGNHNNVTGRECRSARRNPQYSNTAKSSLTSPAPTSPNSSPRMAKIMSLRALGRYWYFWML